MPLSDRILDILAGSPGLSDRELTNLLFSPSTHPSQINQECRLLAQAGQLVRRSQDGLIRNFVGAAATALPSDPIPVSLPETSASDFISEDQVKQAVKSWLESDGWFAEVKWGRDRGIDILATRTGQRWIVEAKGLGSLPAMRVNYFIAMLGETLQRMNDPKARYSIALPDVAQFRGLWERLPALAKSRTGISMLLVGPDGSVRHLTN